MLQDVFSGFIKLHILYHAAQAPVYGLWLIEELSHHGYTLSPGTLYPTLHGLEEQGYLTSHREVIEGRQRRYYVITPTGEAALSEARRRLKELVDEVCGDAGCDAPDARNR
ncbi:MAG: helix-turn-helix transcriptional regulator [Chloroflexi bacterium]|nr:helix-turn-helix transcriptional regulator [Chloroflexota bacterium]